MDMTAFQKKPKTKPPGPGLRMGASPAMQMAPPMGGPPEPDDPMMADDPMGAGGPGGGMPFNLPPGGPGGGMPLDFLSALGGGPPPGPGGSPGGMPGNGPGLPLGGSLPPDGDTAGSPLLAALASSLEPSAGDPYAVGPNPTDLNVGRQDPGMGLEGLLGMLALSMAGVGGGASAGRSGVAEGNYPMGQSQTY